MMAQATCKFCACTDDTIQVICENRCLICSRCQLVPTLRKLLIDHTVAVEVNAGASGPQQQARTYLKGYCPICENAMCATMLAHISAYKELYKTGEDDDKTGRHMTGMELEERTNLIAGFLKRFRATYDSNDRKQKEAALAASQSQQPSAPGQVADPLATMACAAEIYELYTQHNHTKATMAVVMEFIADCYVVMWQNIVRNGKDSMIVMMFKLFNRKRFSQRTNDLRAKGMLDYLASIAGSETPDLLLFSKLIGLQPKQTPQPRPAWGYITAAIMAAGHCDRILKQGQLVDLSGNPAVAEVRKMLSKSIAVDARQPAFKNIPLRKAIRIVELLCKVQQPFWVMAPIQPKCVECGSRFPWDTASISRLLNVLIYVGLSEEHQQPAGTSVFGTPLRERTRSASMISMPSIAGSTGAGTGGAAAAAATAATAIMNRSSNVTPFGSPPGTGGGARSRNVSFPAISPMKDGGGNTSMSNSPSATARSMSVATHLKPDSSVGSLPGTPVNTGANVRSGSGRGRSVSRSGTMNASMSRSMSLASGAGTRSRAVSYDADAGTPGGGGGVGGSTRGSGGGGGMSGGGGGGGGRSRTSSTDWGDHMYFNSSKIILLRQLDAFVDKIWRANANKPLAFASTSSQTANNDTGNASAETATSHDRDKREMRALFADTFVTRPNTSTATTTTATGGDDDASVTSSSTPQLERLRRLEREHMRQQRLDHLQSLDTQRFPQYILMNFDQAHDLVDDRRMISLSELALVCVHCWDVEYKVIKSMLVRGLTTFSRRPAISGFYDPSKAKMTGVERLCMIRLLHWYSTPDDEFLGIDWDDVEMNAKERLFPFAIPETLLKKSHNELNHHASLLIEDLRLQREKDEAEDAAFVDSSLLPSQRYARAYAERQQELAQQGMAEDLEYITMEEIERFNREQFLATQTLGYVDIIRQGSINDEEAYARRVRVSRSLTQLALASAPAGTGVEGVGEGEGEEGDAGSSQHSNSNNSNSSSVHRSITAPEALSELDHHPIIEGNHSHSLSADQQAAEALEREMEFARVKAGLLESPMAAKLETGHTLGGIARPLSPSGGGGGMPPKLQKRSLSLGEELTRTADALMIEGSLKSPKGSTKMRRSHTIGGADDIEEERASLRNSLTDLEKEVKNMKIRDPSELMSGSGATGLLIKGSGSAVGKHVHMSVDIDENNSQSSRSSSNNKFDLGKSPHAAAREAIRAVTPSLDESVDIEYNEIRNKQQSQHLVQARARVQSRLSQSGQQMEDNKNFGKLTASKGFKKPALIRMNTQKRRVNIREISVLKVNEFIGEYGEVTVDLTTHLSAESAVRVFLLKDCQVSLNTFQYLADHYFKPWKFDFYIRIDIVNIPLGPHAGTIISQKFSNVQNGFHLLHLNLNGCKIGGQGIRKILKALHEGDGSQNLIRLELQDNEISMAADTFSYIGYFESLKALDVSYNCFTLDTPAQVEIFHRGLSPLVDLEILSVAFNKIQDRGARVVCEIVQEFYPKLTMLDMAGCFLTTKILPVLELLLEHTSRESAQMLFFKRNLFHVKDKSKNVWLNQHNADHNNNNNRNPAGGGSVNSNSIGGDSNNNTSTGGGGGGGGGGGKEATGTGRGERRHGQEGEDPSSGAITTTGTRFRTSAKKLHVDELLGSGDMMDDNGDLNSADAEEDGSDRQDGIEGMDLLSNKLIKKKIELEATGNPRLRELMLQENMINNTQFSEFCNEFPRTILLASKCKLNIGSSSSKYIGVSFPLCYDFSIYGVKDNELYG